MPYQRLSALPVLIAVMHLWSPSLLVAANKITGRVLDENSVPLPGAAVVWVQPPAARGTRASSGMPSGATAVAGSVVADELGQYQATVPTPGVYVLCGTDRDHKQVSSCEWRRYQVVVQVSQDATSTQDITLPKGVNLRVQIHDTASVLMLAARVTVLAVSSDGSFAHARESSTAIGLRELIVTIPRGTDVRLSIDAPVVLTDAGGQVITPRVPILPVAAGTETEALISVFTK